MNFIRGWGDGTSMKSFLKSTLGFGIAAIILNTLWGVITSRIGRKGGWICGFILTGTLWYVNHYLGIVENRKESAFIDMGFAVAICSFSRDFLKNGLEGIVTSAPTFICVIIGGTIAGVVAGIIKRHQKQGE